MSSKYLQQVASPNEAINLRVNDLTVDGTFTGGGGVTTGTHITSWENTYASPVGGNIQYSVFGNTVTLFVPAVFGTLVQSDEYMHATVNLPAALRPGGTRYGLIGTFVTDPVGYVPSVGAFEIESTGSIQIYYKSIADSTSTFEGSNVNYGLRPAGISGGSITYQLIP